eukprot:1159749-Pelagomonas_calceolata.AAC.9
MLEAQSQHFRHADTSLKNPRSLAWFMESLRRVAQAGKGMYSYVTLPFPTRKPEIELVRIWVVRHAPGCPGSKGYKGKRPQSRRLTASLFINSHEVMKKKGSLLLS